RGRDHLPPRSLDISTLVSTLISTRGRNITSGARNRGMRRPIPIPTLHLLISFVTISLAAACGGPDDARVAEPSSGEPALTETSQSAVEGEGGTIYVDRTLCENEVLPTSITIDSLRSFDG